MAREIVWSFEASADIEALANYISRDSIFYAAEFIQETLDVSRSLNEFSERGRIVPEFGNPNIRELSQRTTFFLEFVSVVMAIFFNILV